MISVYETIMGWYLASNHCPNPIDPIYCPLCALKKLQSGVEQWKKIFTRS